MKIIGIYTIVGETDDLIIFRIQNIKVPEITDSLNTIGVGVSYGIIDILEVKATLPPLEMISKKKESISSKISVEEIHKDIINSSAFTIDYIIFIILAAFTAGFGLISDNALIVMASMVLAPLMGPIIGLSFGIIIKDKILIKSAAKAEFLGFIISLFCGVLIGLLYPLLNMMYSSFYPIPVSSMEIINRGHITIIDLFIAIIIGIAAGFSLTGGKFSTSLVGLAVGVSLMPPIVNIGITLILGLFNISVISFAIFLCNLICINLTAILIFKIKKIKKPSKIWIRWWRQPKLPKPESEKKPEGEPEKVQVPIKKSRWGIFSRGKTKLKKEEEIDIKKEIKDEIREEIKEKLKEEITEEIKEELIEKLKKEENNKNNT